MSRISRERAKRQAIGGCERGTERVKMFCFAVVWAKIASCGDLRAVNARASQFGVFEIGLLVCQTQSIISGKGSSSSECSERASGAWVRGLQKVQGSGKWVGPQP